MPNRNKLEIRMKVLLFLILSILIVFIYYLIVQTGDIPGNKRIDTRIVRLKQSEEAKSTKEGSFIDNDGEIITVAEKKGVPAKCLFPESYGILIGYNSPIYGTSNLRNKYSDLLFQGGRDGVGASVKLTTDNTLQQFCYESLGNNVGSIVILENQTGAIRAMVSRSDSNITYNINEIDKKYDIYNKIDEFFYNRATLAQDPPGSTFKIITAAAMTETKNKDYIYEDTGDYNGIHNASNAIYGTLDLEHALIKSSNTYFASAGNMLGGKVLYNKARDFLIGDSIALDFTVLESNLDLEYYQDHIVSQTAFGQGHTAMSPLHIAMIMQSIVNDGRMVKPYLVNTISDDNKTLYKCKTEIIKTTMESSDAKQEQRLLHSVALSYGFDEQTYGKIVAKTGTAQVSSGKYNHIYLVFANEKYTGIISKDKSFESSHTLIPIAKTILKYLAKE